MKRMALPMALALALAACAAPPKRDLALERLQADWRSLDSREDRTRAPLEAARVDDALNAIRAVPKGDADLRRHLADLAELRIAVYVAAVAAARDRERLGALDDERKAILLEASRRDAELARLEAEKLRLQSLARAEEAERLREEADAERARSEEIGAAAEQARADADAARRLAEARAREASLARQEAELASAQAVNLKAQLALLRPVESERGPTLTLGDVFFAPGQSALKNEVRGSLQPVVAFNGRPGQGHHRHRRIHQDHQEALRRRRHRVHRGEPPRLPRDAADHAEPVRLHLRRDPVRRDPAPVDPDGVPFAK
jgi:hypothetical protein